MISMEELLNKKYKLENQPADVQANLKILLEKINKVRALWAKPMTVSSGLRDMADHLRIYAAKGITDKSKIPMKSKHLYGQAVDIADSGLKLTKWLKDNPDILENLDLFCEDGNSNWVHFQTAPFGSYKKGGTRWFKP